MDTATKTLTQRGRIALQQPLMKRRIAMTTVGVLITGVVVGLFKATCLGVDPFQVFCTGLGNVIPLPYGTLYTLINAVLLAGMFLADRHYIGIGTIINLFLLGYVAQYTQAFVSWLLPEPSMVVRILLLITAVVVLCAASALYFTADLGVSTYDVWALVLDRKTKAPFRLLRIGTDVVCVLVGFVLMGCRNPGIIGIGTIITALFMGPLVDFFNRRLARPMLYGKDGEGQK